MGRAGILQSSTPTSREPSESDEWWHMDQVESFYGESVLSGGRTKPVEVFPGNLSSGTVDRNAVLEDKTPKVRFGHALAPGCEATTNFLTRPTPQFYKAGVNRRSLIQGRLSYLSSGSSPT